jgi:hypothetical protein
MAVMTMTTMGSLFWWTLADAHAKVSCNYFMTFVSISGVRGTGELLLCFLSKRGEMAFWGKLLRGERQRWICSGRDVRIIHNDDFVKSTKLMCLCQPVIHVKYIKFGIHVSMCSDRHSGDLMFGLASRLSGLNHPRHRSNRT